MKEWPSFKKRRLKQTSYNEREYLWWKKMFNLTYRNKSKNWDYQWTYQNFYKNRFSIVPKKNLVSNIGVLNGHGKNSSSLFNLKLKKINLPLIHPLKIAVDKNLDNKICNKTYILPLITYRLKNKIKNLLSIN